MTSFELIRTLTFSHYTAGNIKDFQRIILKILPHNIKVK